ncbi:hypothetical protein HYW58_01230 [Candidatus Kaiserbacteria bacterium]|nr:hypothetical protein [Candidatus Kaiserbacteria bacterium]
MVELVRIPEPMSHPVAEERLQQMGYRPATPEEFEVFKREASDDIAKQYSLGLEPDWFWVHIIDPTERSKDPTERERFGAAGAYAAVRI